MTWMKRMAHLFMTWMGDDPDPYWEQKHIETPTGLLKFWDSMGGHILELGFFLSVAWTMWHRFGWPNKPLRDIKEWIPYLVRAVPPCFLVLLFGAIYRASRRSAKAELAISQKLFSSERLPAEWSSSKDPVWITLSVVCFFLGPSMRWGRPGFLPERPAFHEPLPVCLA